MELWNCENGYAAILRYETGDTVRSRTCELTWRSSWHSTIGADVIKAWKHAAYQLSHTGGDRYGGPTRGSDVEGVDTILAYAISKSPRLEFVPFPFSQAVQPILADYELKAPGSYTKTPTTSSY
ncbi:hypothetical protein DHEL01_v212479 [Diaporthe helianthi]|uniref:DUF6546 domain-containing protein n=1 Tax=Diaporthe helianthi TaxID=158607 RepID=A0A2P5HFW0_DIAHE|nr:hypothetical protein DHEL01_v212479 [Diaporthe helianthi]